MPSAVLAASLVFLVAASLPATAIAPRARSGRPPVVRPIGDPATALLAVLDLERQSCAYYRAVLDRHASLHPFATVYRSELRLRRSLADALTARSIVVPPDPWRDRPPAAHTTADEALAAAVQLERRTVAACDRAGSAVMDLDLLGTLHRLRSESAAHLGWFRDPESCPTAGAASGAARSPPDD